GVTHSIDMAVVTPVFYQGQLVAFCGSIAHKSDLGGMVPGTGSGSAREIFHEGVLFPVVRFMHRGTTVAEVERILRANSRTPEVVLGDVRGQVGTARLGEQRLQALMDRYGRDVVCHVFHAVCETTETYVRSVLRQWPDGVYEGEAFVDNDGVRLDRVVRYHVRVEKQADRILFDFCGSDDQTLGPLNVLPALVRGCCYFALAAVIDPHLSKNGGLARVVETRFREGSVLFPRFPAPTNTYMASAVAATEAILQALGQMVPDKRVAGTGGVGGLMIGGQDERGRPFVQYEVIGSAYGARQGKDGVSGVSVLLDNARTAPIEILEMEFPVRVRRFELIPDSGGAGQYRGGLGILREYEILAPEAQFSLRGGKHTVPAAGVDGGRPGRPGRCILQTREGQTRELPSRFGGVVLKRGDVVRLEKAGGGGLGLPALRPLAKIVEDCLDGYISFAAAVRDYGVDPAQLQACLTEQAGACRFS
ncbi:MAG: hydantoinase B/oxoprolinase family protein, partial [Alicyclobacillus sp.]|nr:hydantoinase B/oxoprolinase family protein [Alicyclobacillus sp.]